MRTVLAACTVFGLVACSVELDLADGAVVTCVSATDCPEGYRCLADGGVCALVNPPSDGVPAVTSASVTPERAAATTVITVTLATDVPLLIAPRLRLVTGVESRTLVTQGKGAGPFTATYQVTGAEAEGILAVTADLVATTGATAEGVALGAVELDFTPPELTAVTFDETVVAGQTTWVDTEDLTARLSFAAEAAATVAISGDVVEASDLVFQPALPVTLLAGDGAKIVIFDFADDVGNRATASVAVSLDTASPSNQITILSPTAPEVWLNADAVTALFETIGVSDPDIAGFVASVDQGSSWQVVPNAGFFIVDLGARQDQQTTLWIRERDVFGNLTAETLQAVLTIHEDSQPPGAPNVLTNTISGPLGGESGIFVLPGGIENDPGLRYEIVGATQSVTVTQSPLVPVPAVPQATTSSYALSAIDRAGNRGDAVAITVVDTALRVIDPNPGGSLVDRCSSCMHSGPYVEGSVAAYSEDDGTTERIILCRPGTGAWSCDRWAFTPVNTGQLLSATAVTVAGRNLYFIDRGGGSAPDLRSFDLGPDGRPGTADDGIARTLSTDAVCPKAWGNAVIYGGGPAGARELNWRSVGADGIAGTADDTVVIVSAAADVYDTGMDCPSSFTGRHIVWMDKRSATNTLRLYDLGADQIPNGTDPGEVIVAASVPRFHALSDGRLFIQQDPASIAITDLGTDQTYGTGDDSVFTVAVDGVVMSARGDKLLVATDTDALGHWTAWKVIDVSTEGRLGLFDGASTNTGWDAALGDSFIFGILSSSELQASVPSHFDFDQDPFGYRTSRSVEPAFPGGAWADPLVLLADRGLVANTVAGGTWSLPEADLSTPEGPDADLADGKIVWRSAAGQILLYDFGPDLIPDTDDDQGPDVLYPRTGQLGTLARWPRVDGNRILWVELNKEFFADAPTAFTSAIVLVDLGADGRLDAGDQRRALPTTGLQPLMPDIEGDVIAFLHRPGSQCGASRGELVDADCATRVYQTTVTALAPTVLTNVDAPRAQLLVTSEMVLWAELVNPGLPAETWDVAGCYLTGCSQPSLTPLAIAREPLVDEFAPHLASGVLTYMTTTGPAALLPGVDGVFGAVSTVTDDVAIRRPSQATPANTPIVSMLLPRWEYTSDSGIMVVGAILPSAAPLAVASPTAVAITTSSTVTSVLTLDVLASSVIDAPLVQVAYNHPNGVALSFAVEAPSGTIVPLGSGSGNGMTTMLFSLHNTPALFELFAEPLPGAWTLRVTNGGASTGTLVTWGVQNGW